MTGSAASQPTPRSSGKPGPQRPPWVVPAGMLTLLAVLAVNAPLFLRMPLWSDVTFYDLCARTALRGGIPYKDVFDTNPPGPVWLHMAIRSAAGWGDAAIRAADLVFVAAVAILLLDWLRAWGKSASVQLGAVVALALYYFATTEYCHCQRDVWMLVPALAALALRRRQVARVSGDKAFPAGAALHGLFEGLAWGAALWIKPFVAVPMVTSWVASLVVVRRNRRVLLADAGGLLAGGLLAGLAGAAWLYRVGAWDEFLDIFLRWNTQYAGTRVYSPWVQVVRVGVTLWPWGLVHVVALPGAVAALVTLVTPGRGDRPTESVGKDRALFASFYLGWVVQVVTLQRGYDYHYVPAVFLAVAWLAGMTVRESQRKLAAAVGLGFAVLALATHPGLRPGRLAAWTACWDGGADLRDRLALTDNVDWPALGRVADHLRPLVRGRELTCFTYECNPLYLDLDVDPSTRYPSLNTTLYFFAGRFEQLGDDLARSGHRYVVVDLYQTGQTLHLPETQIAALRGDGPAEVPALFPGAVRQSYPWSQQPRFRAGRYLVLEVVNRDGLRLGGAK